jgi:plasmid stabilization system protein ParE
MARIELAPEVGDDIERILDHLAEYQAEDAPARIQEIIQAIAVLEQNPLIGRPAEADKRELIIGRRSRGHVALYRYVMDIDTVFVLALRSQREAGYTQANL